MTENSNLTDYAVELFTEKLAVNFSLKKRLETTYNVVLEDEQVELVEKIVDNSIPFLGISCCRGFGKTFCDAVGLIDLSIENADFFIGVTAPKEAQAQKVLRQAVRILRKAPQETQNLIDWKLITNSLIPFKNGSFIMAFSGNVATLSEGDHFHVVLNDESHLTPDVSISQKIVPMLGSFKIARLIKTGVALYKNHFYRSMQADLYVKIVMDWTRSSRLCLPGIINIDGKNYPKMTFTLMPRSLKEKLFPNHPELWTDGEVLEADFLTQFMCQWVASIELLLNEEDQMKLLGGTHNILNRALAGEVYFFGLDTAGGSPRPGHKFLDYTALSSYRKRDGRKETVFCKRWKGNIIQQQKEIFEIVGRDGLFPCIFGLVDYSNIGINIVEEFKEEGIPIEGVQYNMNAPNSGGKNFKNAMADHFTFELRSERVKYPHKDQTASNKEMQAGFDECCIIEKRAGSGMNSIIEAPDTKYVDDQGEEDTFHDDIFNSDILAVYAADKGVLLLPSSQAGSTYQIPKGVAGGVYSASNPGQAPSSMSQVSAFEAFVATRINQSQSGRRGGGLKGITDSEWYKRGRTQPIKRIGDK